MMDELATFFETWKADRNRINQELPDCGRGFGHFYQSVMKDGALSLREKELIAMAIAVALRCTPCIYLHARGCLNAGATRAQVLEAATVSVIMQGGPGLVYLPQVMKVLDHLEGDASS